MEPFPSSKILPSSTPATRFQPSTSGSFHEKLRSWSFNLKKAVDSIFHATEIFHPSRRGSPTTHGGRCSGVTVGTAFAEENQILKHKISLLEESKMKLQEALQDSQVERDRLIMQIESIRNGKPVNEIDIKSNKDFDMVKSYNMKIQDLESELIKVRSLNQSRRDDFADYLDSEDDGNHSGNLYDIDADMRTEKDGRVEVVEKELEHSSRQEKLDRELKELDKRLEKNEKLALESPSSETKVGSGYVLQSKGSCNSSTSSRVYGNKLLEDMDTSNESEDDVEWGHTVERKGREGRRKEKHRRKEKLGESICCSCSINSSCKTSRCDCRAVKGSCSNSCRCVPTKCRNRKESSVNLFERDEKESNNDELASHGAMLLQTAFSEKPAGPNDAESVRKPLFDIGNNLALSGIPKPNILRKKTAQVGHSACSDNTCCSSGTTEC